MQEGVASTVRFGLRDVTVTERDVMVVRDVTVLERDIMALA